MIMHELGNVHYLMISYIYLPVISSIYMFNFVILGALIGKNHYKKCGL